MRCKIDDGMLEHLGFEGFYVERWKCRKCRVVWELRPQGDLDTDAEVIKDLIIEKLQQFEKLTGRKYERTI